MLKKFALLGAALALVCVSALPAIADTVPDYETVTTCGTFGPIDVGGRPTVTQDRTGRACIGPPSPPIAGTYIGSVSEQGSGNPSDGIGPSVSAAAENNRPVKGTPGNLYQFDVASQTATAGFVLVINAATVPADGPVTPTICIPIAASGSVTRSYLPGPPPTFNAGIMIVISSGANCFTKTTGVITGFISALAR